LLCIDECLPIDEKVINLVVKEFFHQFRKELSTLSNQLNRYFGLWSSYFKLSQSRHYQLFNDSIFYKKEMFKIEVLKHDSYLIELRQTIHRLENQHQDGLNQILKHFSDLLSDGLTPSKFLPYTNTNKNDFILLAISTMYYSTIKLVRSAVDLGTTMHNIFELETTHQYIRY
jgi:hypothetical protein